VKCSNVKCPWWSDSSVSAKDNCKGYGYLVRDVERCHDFIPLRLFEAMEVEKEIVKPKTTNPLQHMELE